ncbi:methylenetetrahydromethanopterin reductase [Geodermatophilus saharensis]|uniref:Methylenetetrahydromethanopterin reductase n=1 Tax=Geodermatophilus saharensis TaxID=1137994 RepID=A0A239D460_9ACTN|nr:LLM class flavin-dependent oxidoreductase [Geodermatophilus saharensis]SNS27286.1 methylenetetrahydromethanopterin reductase [Geodermatophilus saharensis]
MPAPEFLLRSYPLPDDVGAHAAAAEEAGWDGLLLTDTQNLSMDVVGSLYLAASATSRLRLGTAVTNLVTRHPAVVASTFATLHHVTGGRAHLGVGRGDTALELVGLRPPSAREFEQQLGRLCGYLRGGTVDVDGFGSRITWLPVAGERAVPVDVFGSGPHVIAAAARQADRVTVTVGAEPERVAWAVRTAREARAAAGLDPQTLDVGAFVVVGVGTDEHALAELVRGNASISAHFQRGAPSSLSTADAAVVADVSAHYDTYHHGLEHAAQAESLSEEFLRRFCVIGDPDECVQRLLGLIGLGLSHVTVVGGSRDIDPGVRERSDRLVATEVLPALRSP